MLFRALFAAVLLAGSAIADGKSITASLQAVEKGLVDLDGAFGAYSGGILKALPILGVSNKLKKTIKQGTTTAQKSAPLTIDEAVALVPYVQALAVQSNKTLTTIISKAPLFRKARLDGIVLRQIEDSKQNSGGYSDAILAKVPEALRASAKSLTGPIDTGFDQVIAAYRAPGSGSRLGRIRNDGYDEDDD